MLIHWHDVGTWLQPYGDTSSPSPRVAELASRGIVFEKAFSTAPLCSPARGSLFTGLLPHEHGAQGLAHVGWSYPPAVETMPQLLSERGYESTLIGLQHENVDARVLGFDRVIGGGFLPRCMVVADAACRWLRHRDVDTQPFFLTVGMWETHRPWPADDYRAADPASVQVPGWLPDNEQTRADVAAFHGSIAQADAALGQVLDALDRSDYADNTLVLFTTDHGPAFPRAKGTLYDPGVHVAMIGLPPRSWATPPARVHEQVSHLDALPTFLDLAQSSPGAGLSGRSLAPALVGDPIAGHDSLYFEKTYHDVFDAMRAVRTPQWKYILNLVPGPRLQLSVDLESSLTRRGYGDAHLEPRPDEELYDLTTDPFEMVNLVGEAGSAPRLQQMRELLSATMDRTGDTILTQRPTPPPMVVPRGRPHQEA